MPLVVDASIAIKWLVREPGNDRARELLTLPEPLIAPDWLLVEAASTFWKKVKRSELLVTHAERHIEDLPRFFERLVPSLGLVSEAFRWSVRLKHSVYDCLYLALATQEETWLATADVKFERMLVAAGLADRVRLYV